jgi:hypothetical protein
MLFVTPALYLLLMAFGKTRQGVPLSVSVGGLCSLTTVGVLQILIFAAALSSVGARRTALLGGGIGLVALLVNLLLRLD